MQRTRPGQCALAEIVLLPGAFFFDLRHAGCEERDASAGCDVVEKSLADAGARVMGMMIQTIWHFWCRALWYSMLGSLFMIWLACTFVSVIFIPMMMFFSEPPETLLGKMHLGGFCVSFSFLMLALFVMCPFGMMKDDFASASCRNNVIASIAQKISKVLATAGFHILAVVSVVLVVRTFMMIWARV